MKYSIVKTNIVNVVSDVVVLPSNANLREGRGTSTALFEAAGRRELTQACKELLVQIGELEVGDAVPTYGFDSNAKCIIHSVVPKWVDGNSGEYDALCKTYFNAMTAADYLEYETIAMPLLASGNNGFDLELALEIAVKSIEQFEGKSLKQAVLVIYGRQIAAVVRAHDYQYVEIADNIERVKKTKKDNYKVDREKMAKEFLKRAKPVLEYLKNPENIRKIAIYAEVVFNLAKAVKKKDIAGAIDILKKV